jgi:hypothetical protein
MPLPVPRCRGYRRMSVTCARGERGHNSPLPRTQATLCTFLHAPAPQGACTRGSLGTGGATSARSQLGSAHLCRLALQQRLNLRPRRRAQAGGAGTLHAAACRPRPCASQVWAQIAAARARLVALTSAPERLCARCRPSLLPARPACSPRSSAHTHRHHEVARARRGRPGGAVAPRGARRVCECLRRVWESGWGRTARHAARGGVAAPREHGACVAPGGSAPRARDRARAARCRRRTCHTHLP